MHNTQCSLDIMVPALSSMDSHLVLDTPAVLQMLLVTQQWPQPAIWQKSSYQRQLEPWWTAVETSAILMPLAIAWRI